MFIHLLHFHCYRERVCSKQRDTQWGLSLSLISKGFRLTSLSTFCVESKSGKMILFWRRPTCLVSS